MTQRTPRGTDRIVACPACKGPSVYAVRNPWRPFCSERCKRHDLGAWASEQYSVPSPPTALEAADDASDPMR